MANARATRLPGNFDRLDATKLAIRNQIATNRQNRIRRVSLPRLRASINSCFQGNRLDVSELFIKTGAFVEMQNKEIARSHYTTQCLMYRLMRTMEDVSVDTFDFDNNERQRGELFRLNPSFKPLSFSLTTRAAALAQGQRNPANNILIEWGLMERDPAERSREEFEASRLQVRNLIQQNEQLNQVLQALRREIKVYQEEKEAQDRAEAAARGEAAPEALEGPKESEFSCPICMEKFNHGDIMVAHKPEAGTTCCSAFYHDECIHAWLGVVGVGPASSSIPGRWKCPACRQDCRDLQRTTYDHSVYCKRFVLSVFHPCCSLTNWFAACRQTSC